MNILRMCITGLCVVVAIGCSSEPEFQTYTEIIQEPVEIPDPVPKWSIRSIEPVDNAVVKEGTQFVVRLQEILDEMPVVFAVMNGKKYSCNEAEAEIVNGQIARKLERVYVCEGIFDNLKNGANIIEYVVLSHQDEFRIERTAFVETYDWRLRLLEVSDSRDFIRWDTDAGATVFLRINNVFMPVGMGPGQVRLAERFWSAEASFRLEAYRDGERRDVRL